MRPRLFIPIIDNGMGLSRTSWALSLAVACLTTLRDYSATIQSISYPYPDGAMNIATATFLASDCDEMIVIDTDVAFTREHLAMLLSHDEPLVFGLYPKKQPGLEFPVVPLASRPLPFHGDGPALREVERCARGFMRAKREVFEKMKSVVGTYRDAQTQSDEFLFWQNLPGGHSEDFNFCDNWRKLGGKILVDSRICAQHEGSALYPIPGTFTNTKQTKAV